MQTGSVKVWEEIKGWGFILGDDGEDYFVHINNIRAGQRLKEGTKVKFDLQEGQKGLQAINVTKY